MLLISVVKNRYFSGLKCHFRLQGNVTKWRDNFHIPFFCSPWTWYNIFMFLTLEQFVNISLHNIDYSTYYTHCSMKRRNVTAYHEHVPEFFDTCIDNTALLVWSDVTPRHSWMHNYFFIRIELIGDLPFNISVLFSLIGCIQYVFNILWTLGHDFHDENSQFVFVFINDVFKGNTHVSLTCAFR